MKRIETNAIGIDQGDIVLFSDFENDGEMWTGEGARLVRSAITFSGKYRTPPSVMVSLSMWDMSTGANTRADVKAEDITKTGFDIVFRTWGDTRVARVRVAWQAIGALETEDTWEL